MKLLIVEGKETLTCGDLIVFNTKDGNVLLTKIKDMNIGEILLEIIGGYAEYMELEESY